MNIPADITARYLAGETDLKAETAFLFKTQGPAAAYDFARAFDEEVGSEPYLKIMGYIEKLEADAIAPKVNTAEQNRVALELANKMAKNKAEMEKNLNLANDITLKRNEPLPELVTEKEAGLFPSMDKPMLSGGLGLDRHRIGGTVFPGRYGYMPDPDYKESIEEETESAKVSPVLLVSIAAILIYFIVKK
jgi:hypothetical protein